MMSSSNVRIFGSKTPLPKRSEAAAKYCKREMKQGGASKARLYKDKAYFIIVSAAARIFSAMSFASESALAWVFTYSLILGSVPLGRMQSQ